MKKDDKIDESNNENLNDINQNEVPDIKELPSNVASKLTMLVDTVDK